MDLFNMLKLGSIGDSLLMSSLMIPCLSLFFFWALIITPIRFEIRQRVGQAVYLRILKEYNEITNNRMFAALSLVLVFFAIGLIFTTVEFRALISRESFDDQQFIAFIFLFLGIHFYVMGLTKAISNVIQELSKDKFKENDPQEARV